MDEATIQKLLEEARKQCAPDHRTRVFEVQARWEKGKLLLTGEIHDEEMKNKLLQILKARKAGPINDELTVLPNPSLGTKTLAVASASVVNLRKKPDHVAELGTQALLGTPLSLLDKKKSWYLAQTPDGYLGWTEDLIAFYTPVKFLEWAAIPKVIVTSLHCTTFLEEGGKKEMVSDLVAGALLGWEGEQGSAYKVRYPDGRRALLEKKEAQPLRQWLSLRKPAPDSIETTARQFMGIPYLWGGNTAKGMDCSGFTKLVFFLNGLEIPRDADQQALAGFASPRESNLANLSKGDLLFFGSPEEDGKPAKVMHVAISLGQGLFIHSFQDVRINSLVPGDYNYSQQRHKTFLFARKFLGDPLGDGIVPMQQIPYFQGRAEFPAEPASHE
jgi:cell wall-associated NlpC family hydrolase